MNITNPLLIFFLIDTIKDEHRYNSILHVISFQKMHIIRAVQFNPKNRLPKNCVIWQVEKATFFKDGRIVAGW